MNKDHRSAGLWWSLLLSGGSLGGHDSSLDLISSCFVFPIISPITAGVAADILWKCLPHLMVNGKISSCFVIIWLGDPCFFHWKSTPSLSRAPHPKKGGKEHHVGCFWLSIFRLFWQAPCYHSRCMFGLSGPACVLGLIDGRMPLSLIFYCHRLLGFICLGLGPVWQKKRTSTAV